MQCGGIASGLDLIDVNADLCRGQALDLLHGSSIAADQRIRATGYEAIPESDLICITAGLRRKPDESRLDLINRNVELFLGHPRQVKAAGPKKEAIVLVVSNPVDVLTYLATIQLGLPSTQVIGLGTELDSARFRSLIAEALKLPPTQVTATILGEHGDSMVPIWSAAQAAGLPLEKFPGWTSGTADALFARTRGSGAEVIKLKGGPGSPSAWRSATSSTRSPSTASGSCPSPRWSTGLTGCATSASRSRRSSAGGGSRRSSKSSSGPRKSRPCSTRARSSGGRSTRS